MNNNAFVDYASYLQLREKFWSGMYIDFLAGAWLGGYDFAPIDAGFIHPS